MKRFIVAALGGIFTCSALFAFQPIEGAPLSIAQIKHLETTIARSLESGSPQQQVEAAMLLQRMKARAPGHEWGRCIIPLMHILNGEQNEAPARLLAAMLLHELRSERGDFAISRNAQFTDDARVKRYCEILTRTRLIEKAKL